MKYESRTACKSTRGTRRPLAVEYFEERIELRFRAGRVDLEDPLLAGPGREAEEVGIGRAPAAPASIAPVTRAGSVSRLAWPGALFGSCSETSLDLRRLRRFGRPRAEPMAVASCTGLGGRDRVRRQRAVHPPDLERCAVAGERQRRRHVGLVFPELELAIVAGSPDLDRAVLGQRDELGCRRA